MSSLQIALVACALVVAVSLVMWLVEMVRTTNDARARDAYLHAAARRYRR